MIWEEEDSFVLPKLGRAIETLLANIDFHWLAGASHQARSDKPAEVAEIIQSKVTGTRRTGSIVGSTGPPRRLHKHAAQTAGRQSAQRH